MADRGLDVRVLGPVEVLAGGRPVPLGGPRQRAVLAMLALAAPDVVSTDRLVDGLWGEHPPARPLPTLQVFVHNLRKLLRSADPDRTLIASRAPGYALTVEPHETDLHRFSAAQQRARELRAGGRLAEAADLLDDVLGSWRGPALADVREAPFAEAEGVRLDELRLQAEEESFDLALQLGRHSVLLPLLEERVTSHPMRERFWGQLMVALYRSDRQAEALAAYGRARDRLADELGIDPGEALRQLEVAVLRQDPGLAAPQPSAPQVATVDARPAAGGGGEVAAAPPPARRSGRVPQVLSTTHGRDELVDAVLDLVRSGSSRLVTLVGPGGSGKSRVAAVAASHASPSYPGGVWWLTATEATDAGQLAVEIAHLLTGSDAPGDDPFAGLDPTLELPATLVVLDDLEALEDDAGEVVRALLDQAPHVTVLVTSRVPLQAGAERVVPVEPLAPAPAVALFLDRWTAGRGRDVSAAERGDVDALCRFLDGSPLALELAAARARLMSPRAVLAALRDDLTLLSTRGGPASSARHRTLEAVVQWSFDRLEPGARTVCGRVAVFERGFTVEAVEAVCADVPDVLDALTQLLDARLVRSVESRVDVRLALLGTVRSFARSRLAAGADVDQVHEQLARHLLEQVQTSACDLDGPDCALALARFDDDAADVATAHAWCLDHGHTDLAATLACSSHDFWIASGRPHDGLGLLTRTLAAPGLGSAQRAALHAAAGATAYHLTDWDRATAECRAALELLGDPAAADAPEEERRAAVMALTYAAGAAAVTGRAEEAAGQAERALAAARELGLYPLEAISLSMRAIAAAVAGDFETERRTYEERLEVVRAHGDDARLADTLNTLAEIALDEQDAETARAYGQESLRMAGTLLVLEARDAQISLARADVLAGDLDDAALRLREALRLSDSTRQSLAVAQSLRVGGCLAQASGRPEAAVRVFAAAQRLSPSPSGRDEPVEQDLAQGLAAARAAVGERAYARLWELGTRLPVQSARQTLEEVLAGVAGRRPEVATITP